MARLFDYRVFINTNTPTPTPTNTPTPTPTPTPSGTNITIYSKQGASGGSGYDIYYSTTLCGSKGGPTWTLACSNLSSTTCASCATINMPQNTTITMLVVTTGGDPYGYISGISYNASDNTSTCPANSIVYCDYGDCGGTSFTFDTGTTAKNIAITVYVGKLGYSFCPY